MAEIAATPRGTEDRPSAERPTYERPRIQVMTEREVLNSFQITQSMAGWWTTGAC